MELTKNNWSHSQLSHKFERKKTERNTRNELSSAYHLIMFIFSLFHFVTSMQFVASISF